MIKKKLIAAVVSVATIASVGTFVLQGESASAGTLLATCSMQPKGIQIHTHREYGPYIVEYEDGEQFLLHEEGGTLFEKSDGTMPEKFKMPRVSNSKWVYCPGSYWK